MSSIGTPVWKGFGSPAPEAGFAYWDGSKFLLQDPGIEDVTDLPETLSDKLPVYNAASEATWPANKTAAIQAAVTKAAAAGGHAKAYIPGGTHDINDQIVVPTLSGIDIFGVAGTLVPYDPLATTATVLRAGAGLAGKPMFKFSGTSKFRLHDITLDGNNNAAYGIVVLTPGLGAASGVGRIENVYVWRCTAEGINLGNGGLDANAADITMNRVEVQGCPIGFRAEKLQSVNEGLRDCTFGDCAVAMLLKSCSLHASMMAVWGCGTVVKSDRGGSVTGAVTLLNLKIESEIAGQRTIIFDGNGEGQATADSFELIVIGASAGYWATGGQARFKLYAGQTATVIGGRGLVGEAGGAGPLVEMDGTAGACGFLATGCWLPDDPGLVVGDITEPDNCTYRLRNCFNTTYGEQRFLRDYGQTSLEDLGINAADITPFARTLLDDGDNAKARQTLGAASVSEVTLLRQQHRALVKFLSAHGFPLPPSLVGPPA